jgi:pilus assembly protein FimV
MSRRFHRILPALAALLMSSGAWAIGLGDIRLDSALNEPLRAEIDLLSATPEELESLKVSLASGDTFERYGLDRPVFLQGIQFNIVRSGRADGNIVQLRSAAPITEPFLTFLIEANWPRGRLLREYTVLLDPPTFAPPAAQQAPAVQAPSRSTPADSGRIERQPAPQPSAQQPATRPMPQTSAQPAPEPIADDTPYNNAQGGDVYVQRGDTLWGVASRSRPDSRLSMNQTMMAIFEANPEAFDGNINRLRAGASLRIPSADEIYQISRGEALNQVQQQNASWGGAAPVDTGPSLTLVPPDDEDVALPYDDDIETDFEPAMSREEEVAAQIAEIEASPVPDQQALIDIRNDQLAELRRELADIRGEVYEPPVEDTGVADDDIFVDETDEAMADEQPAEDLDSLFPDQDEMAADDEAVADADDEAAIEDADAEPVTPTRAEPEQSLVDKILDMVTGIWGIIGAAVVVVAGVLIWFLRRGGDEDDSGPWESLDDEEEIAAGAMSATESLAAPQRGDDGMVVVEQESAIRPLDDTIDEPVEIPMPEEAEAATGELGSLEDTFSSETAVNLDQQDPLAEADFHMAYGLYDQAADLVNGALEADPNDKDLLAKLCEIYFVWGNRDAFIDAAGRLKGAAGGQESADWDKVVIMGQQIASDDALFAGASAAGATKAVDLSFEGGMEEEGALDIDFGGDGGGDDIIDLGATPPSEDEAVDFLFTQTATEAAGEIDVSLDVTAESPTIESPLDDEDSTAEVPTAEVPIGDITKTVEMASPESTVETPTIEQQFSGLDGTSELPSIDESFGDAAIPTDSTAEINLDDLGLDVADLDATGTNEILDDLADVTGKNPEIDLDQTGVSVALDLPEDSLGGDLDLDLEDALSSTGEMRLATDETGASPALTPEDTGVGIEDLLDATGMTQVISEDMAVETAADVDKLLSDADATMLAGLDDDEGEATAALSDEEATVMAPSFSDSGEEDFDFAKTEALPPEAFTGSDNLDETSEIPAVAETDVDLDLDDLTAALQVSQAGDTVDMPRDDATVEQPRPNIPEEGPTVSLAPEDISDDLNEARTMTEVGTKLDLARAYVDMGDPAGARSILEEVLDEGDDSQQQQAQQLLDSLPS